jgi:predicted transcriptional regulator
MAKIEYTQIKEKDLVKLCQKVGITLKQLSEEIDVSYEHLSRMNSGVVRTTYTRWIQIKNVLDKYKSK